jgi:LmbE family N-acetylglucosaminyl deacetylase
LVNLIAPPLRSYRGLLYVASRFHNVDVDVNWQPGSERILVLAPHMDDEVLGCGGAIALHRRAGANVTVVFLTDGRWGSSGLRGLLGAELREAQARLVDSRKQEARAALRILDIANVEFLDAPDGALDGDQGAPERLRAVLARTSPQIVYLPSFLEQHPDHRAANTVLINAVGEAGAKFYCHAYEVWTPHYPNCFVGIDEVLDVKRSALSQYRSQLADADFEHGILGLNAYRALMRPRPGRRYAEAFCALRYDDYLRAFRDWQGS